MKPVIFLGDSLDRIRAFGRMARRDAGYQLDRVQCGKYPADWKPLKTVGPGVREIRIRDATGAYRVVYAASLGDFVYVLHAFQKKTRATAGRDLELATKRYAQLMRGSI